MVTRPLRFLTKRAVVIALALCCVATGCQRDAATTAERAHVVPDEAAVLTATELIAIANVLRDAEERVLPRLGDDAAARALRRELDRLAGVLGESDAARLIEAARRTHAALDAVRADSTLADDLHAVGLVVSHVHALAVARQPDHD